MGFSPAFDTPDTGAVITETRVEVLRPLSAQVQRTVLRFGGLTLDTATGAAHWSGKALTLSVAEREMLGVLMRRAGQIVSRERLTMVVGRSDLLDERIRGLRETLKASGVTALPREVSGLGYILWRA